MLQLFCIYERIIESLTELIHSKHWFTYNSNKICFYNWFTESLPQLICSKQWFIHGKKKVTVFMGATLGAFDLKRRCTEWSLYDIKVPARAIWMHWIRLLSYSCRGYLMSYSDHSASAASSRTRLLIHSLIWFVQITDSFRIQTKCSLYDWVIESLPQLICSKQWLIHEFMNQWLIHDKWLSLWVQHWFIHFTDRFKTLIHSETKQESFFFPFQILKH